MTTVGTPLFLVLYLAAVVQSQDDCNGVSCYPPLGDLMVGRNAQLSATSTCGLDGPQKYCILGHLEDEQKCFTCDSRQPYDFYNNRISHQIENIITAFDPERKLKWWQSENGVHRVSIRLDLESLFQFSHLVLTFKSFRPAAMLVERSKDYGRTWKVFRYFAEDCRLSFPGISEGPADGVDDVICDSRYSGAEPSTDGEVVLKALDPNFRIEDPYSPEIQDLITLTNLRVNFTRLLTLGDTLLGRKRRNPQEKYYYALYEMVVRGSCFCNGHATQCVPAESTRGDVFTAPGMVHGHCVCHHSTAGSNCERCQDFYNDTPWKPGGQSDSSACKRCNCNGHSDQCHFDIAVYLASGEVSGGVCDNCQNNRVGVHCEVCGPFFYQDPRAPTDHPNACIPCDCDPIGSLNGGLCDPSTGQCVCKRNVEGERCDRCRFGFFGLTQEDPDGCQDCRCNVLGSVQTPYPCDPVTGACVCQRFAIGPLCDQCLPGYWGLGNTVYSCSPCDCDIGGAYNSRCSPMDGQCQCLPNMAGRTCNAPAPGYFLAPLDFYVYEAELATPIERRGSSLANPTVTPECEEYYRERGYDLKYQDGKFILVERTKRSTRKKRQSSIPVEPGSAHQLIARQRPEDQLATWTGPGFVRVQDGAGLRFFINNLPASLDYALIIRFEPESSDSWAAIVKVLLAGSPGDGVCPGLGEKQTIMLSGSGRTSILDPFMCLNGGGEYFIDIVFEQRTNYDPQPGSFILIDSIGLIPKIDSLQNFCTNESLEEFRLFGCIGLGADIEHPDLPAVCENLIISMSARIHNGAVPCRCNAEGAVTTSCSKLGGVCLCKPNVIGRCCDSCAPQTFGFGPDGCTPCDCNPQGSIEQLCDQVTGQCSCRQEVTGRQCDRCLPGHFGAPQCRPCQCNGLAEHCDATTGVCLDCRDHSTGPNCERCEEGYSGDPVSGEACVPCLCPELQDSGRFFAQSCTKDPDTQQIRCNCNPGHTGPRCDICSPGFYGDLTLPGARCAKCPCNNNIDPQDRSACNSVTGECLRCLHNTTGPQCQSCKRGYYGDALAKNCTACQCNALADLCDPTTGVCLACRDHSTGPNCERCEEGYSGDPVSREPCVPCLCPELQDSGRFFAQSCTKDPDTQQIRCNCNPGHTGPRCDICSPGFYGDLILPGARCVECPCNNNIDPQDRSACNLVTGECLRCLHNTTGPQCQSCKRGYYGDALAKNCTACQCNALADLCDPSTGVCLACRDHSTGPNCERCVEGYYGDPASGEPCEPCLCPDLQSSGRFFAQSCTKDPDDQQVRCNCNPGHTGPHCDICSPGFYGDLRLPGDHCEECPCNNNIDPQDRNACNSVTGECLRCLHNTTGPQCQSCKRGYYGDALAQNCKACSCDPRGTEITLCPVGNPCQCEQLTGNCTCRSGVVGALCNECADGFWNFNGPSGCQPCDCDPTNSLNNHCNKTTGQCQCQPEYGGRQCDECAENYFGNPDLQCITCECNMEGTGHPACDPYTGECICRPGVTGTLCDECAPGYEPTFPVCAPCHPCSLMFAENVTEVREAAKRMRSLAPGPEDRPQPDYDPQINRMKKKLGELAKLVSRSSLSHPEIMDAEKLCKQIQMLKDSIDPNLIIIDKTALLNTDIDNIKYQFTKLMDKLIEKIKPIGPKTNPKEVKEALEKIKKYHQKDEEAEKQMKQAKAMLESSKEKQREAKDRLDSCTRKDWTSLERKIKSLSVSDLNKDICGAPGDAKCSAAKCGGALCQDALGARKCGGPNCKGSLPVSQNASKTAEKTEDAILDLLHKLRDSTAEINRAKQQAQDTKDQAGKLMKKIIDSKEKFEKDKDGTKDLIKRVKDYLKDEMVTPEDIEKVAQAVLAIKLPAPPDAIRAMIDKIRDVLVNCSDLQDDLKNLQDRVKTAQDLLEKAKEVQDKTKDIDAGNIKKAVEDAEKAQDTAKKNLEEAKRDKDTLDNKLKDIEKKLSNTEINLDPQRIKELVDATDALKNKMEMNRQQAKDAKAAADSAQAGAKDAEQDLKTLTDLFETLKKMEPGQIPRGDEVKDRLENIAREAGELAKDIQDKILKATDLEKRIEDLAKRKDEKEQEVIKLLEEAKELRTDIADRAAAYINC